MDTRLILLLLCFEAVRLICLVALCCFCYSSGYKRGTIDEIRRSSLREFEQDCRLIHGIEKACKDRDERVKDRSE